ncbi:MAG: YHYH protein [Deltaproteobacteria bacterium]|nr:YHYH protein [Deltaproteobacteria bacterium]
MRSGRITRRAFAITIVGFATPALLALAVAQTKLLDLASGRYAQGAMDRRSLAEPARNTIYSCDRQVMGEALNRPWVDSSGVIDFAKKPVVEGSKSWNGQLNVHERPEQINLAGDGLPNHATGNFPIDRASAAYRYDRNPNVIQAYGVQFTIPSNPRIAAVPGCLPMGIIGVALSGAVFFNALDAPGRDAVAHEIFDECEGHPERNGRYHYHHFSPCFDQGDSKAHSPLIGYALDGFAIYGPRDAAGVYIANDKLDECHGHIGPVATANGGTKTVYHYHANREFPYTLGCFRGGAIARPERPRPPPRRAEIGGDRVPADAQSAAVGSEYRVAFAAAPIAANDLSVITLGTGGPPANAERAGPSGLVRYGNVRLLVDMGRDTQLRLQQANVSLRDLSALLFTHHHLDHNEEFVPILLKARLQGGAAQIIGPPGTKRFTDFVLDFYKDDSDYRAQRTGGSGEVMRNVTMREVSGGENFSLYGLTVRTARVNHTIHTVAYRFDAGEKSIVISGDLSFSPSLIELARDADVLVMDAGPLNLGPTNQPQRPNRANPSRAHSTLVEVAEMARQANVKRLVLTHFANARFSETLSRGQIAEIFKGEVIFAKDLLEVSP